MQKTQYITTALPYVNAKPHIGFAMEMVRADCYARFKKLMGYDVFFNTGTDEHGQKIYESAQISGQDVQNYVDSLATKFKDLIVFLGISDDIHFIRTTDTHHIAGAQELWCRVRDNGYIYKSRYTVKYCVGCELEKSDSELVDGQCALHPNSQIQRIDEENYFFKFSAFQQKLLDYYKQNPQFVQPDFRFNEIKSFVESGLQDFSISRIVSKMPWGVPVPDDETAVMYVWFDALANYITTLGWPDDNETFEKYWKNGAPLQFAGQDNLRQQSAMWQAMLMAANLPLSHTIYINGFIMGSDGQKMSKSIGNVVDPLPLRDYYGVDALRYFLLHYINPEHGSPVSYDTFYERYTSDLVNGIGNLTSRLMNMAEQYLLTTIVITLENLPEDYISAYESFRPDIACDIVMKWVSELDTDITKTEPFKLIKTDPDAARRLVGDYVIRLYTIACMLQPIMPNTSDLIKQIINENKKPALALFPRLEKPNL